MGPGHVATMRYDGVGRRTTKKIENSADFDATYRYYYDGQKLLRCSGFAYEGWKVVEMSDDQNHSKVRSEVQPG